MVITESLAHMAEPLRLARHLWREVSANLLEAVKRPNQANPMQVPQDARQILSKLAGLFYEHGVDQILKNPDLLRLRK